MKVIYMGTPEFAVPALVNIYNEGYDIPLVVTQEDKPKGRGKKLQHTAVKEKALELGLEVFQPHNINDIDAVNKIKEIKPDFIVVAAYGQILKEELLNTPKYCCLNIHASLLPRYRGAAPINWAIINGEIETGISIMRMEKGLDSGDTILIESVPISAEDDFITVHDELARLGGDMITKAMKEIVNQNALFTPQEHDKSNYAPMIFKETGRIDWNKNGDYIYNLVRGLKPWPNAFTYYKDEMVKIHKVSFLPEKTNMECGQIIKVDKKGIYVSVNDGQIILKELQFPGKKVLTVAQYLAGNSLDTGIILK